MIHLKFLVTAAKLIAPPPHGYIEQSNFSILALLVCKTLNLNRTLNLTLTVTIIRFATFIRCTRIIKDNSQQNVVYGIIWLSGISLDFGQSLCEFQEPRVATVLLNSVQRSATEDDGCSLLLIKKIKSFNFLKSENSRFWHRNQSRSLRRLSSNTNEIGRFSWEDSGRGFQFQLSDYLIKEHLSFQDLEDKKVVNPSPPSPDWGWRTCCPFMCTSLWRWRKTVIWWNSDWFPSSPGCRRSTTPTVRAPNRPSRRLLWPSSSTICRREGQWTLSSEDWPTPSLKEGKKARYLHA